MDPNNDSALVDSAKEKCWAPVDVYVGGAEHATRHLIYARFWHKFLHDIGIVSTPEPFTRLISVGLIMAEDGRKMSKRFGNVINPDDIVDTYGADTLRIYEMFMGPFTDAIAWKTASLIGARRFLERVWKLQESFTTATNADVERVLNQSIKKVGEDIQNFKFNTAISQMMIFINEAERGVTKEQYQKFITLLAPFAPHIADEIWQTLGSDGSVNVAQWPSYDESKLLADTVTLAVQVDGKARAEITLPRDAAQPEAEKAAKEAAAKWLEGKQPMRVVFVANRLVNLVLA
jgi:leucyl-tRNA synthetase